MLHPLERRLLARLEDTQPDQAVGFFVPRQPLRSRERFGGSLVSVPNADPKVRYIQSRALVRQGL